ncbi:hypothetical protein SKAU_G00256620 [Synaphobranchus kaupii]|uniref:Uncharacterized protein n=1 Tax=Synaphobranchus kaupii TaxID=118154 RepID=A0A9Q1F3V6_SYNKA|nr:hypothetical protein SKAU_G00256620 [Synaphobranchus kaupii]
MSLAEVMFGSQGCAEGRRVYGGQLREPGPGVFGALSAGRPIQPQIPRNWTSRRTFHQALEPEPAGRPLNERP